jgi:hypothetical protein
MRFVTVFLNSFAMTLLILYVSDHLTIRSDNNSNMLFIFVFWFSYVAL